MTATAKFNTATRPAGHGYIDSDLVPTGTTYEGAPGYARSAQSELYLLGVSNMVGEDTFYEPGHERDSRYASLVRHLACEDPDWTARFLVWLRRDANLRSAAMVGSAEFLRARLDANLPGHSRQLLATVMQRADEPGEWLAYWTSRYGRAIPKAAKRGLSEAVWRLYTEKSWLKWDSPARQMRFADVLSLIHPTGSLADTSSKPIKGTWRAELYGHILDARHGHDDGEIPQSLRTIRARRDLMAKPAPQRREWLLGDPAGAREAFASAGMTWESVAGWIQGPMDAPAWEAIIPSMRYMALLRNLRNFDAASIDPATADSIAATLADPAEVASSRQLPLRFMSAYRAAPSLRWAWPLEQALTESLASVPAISGATLIMVDTSSSMASVYSRHGSLAHWDAAALFGLALAARAHAADVVSYSGGNWGHRTKRRFPLRPGESLLSATRRWSDGGFNLGGGTDTAGAVQAYLEAKHDRVVILTDEQGTGLPVDAVVPAAVPLYTYNLAGYRYGHTNTTGNRYVFGGLNDAGLRAIPLLERGQHADWPF